MSVKVASLLMMACCLAHAQVRMIPHLTRPNGGFTTTVILENDSIDSQEYRLMPYGEDGTALNVVTGTLAGQSLFQVPANDLFTDEQPASHFSIEGTGIRASVAYQSVTTPGSPAQVSETSEHATRYRMFAGDWARVFDGFAVVNTGSQSADVWVAQRAEDGKILQSQRALEGLAPLAKGLFVIGAPELSLFTPVAGATYEVYASQPLAITALRGDIPGSAFLWVNQAQARCHALTNRDAQGVWFIEEGSLYDVIEAMGFAVAEDRLWQAETFRFAALGRLTELPGNPDLESAFEQDVLTRTLGYSDEEYAAFFAGLTAEGRTLVKAYADGFNRRIAEVRADPSLLPAEFTALNHQPADWKSQDVLAVVSLLMRSFDPLDFGQTQLDNAAILQSLEQNYPDQAAAMFEDLRWINDPDAVTMIPTDELILKQASAPGLLGPLRQDVDFQALADQVRQQRENQREIRIKRNAFTKMGSYAWVLSGVHTTSGNPMLYSGPEMGFSAPALTLEGSIKGGGLEISGMTVAGIPSILVGRTPHHAWSLQVGHAHTTDLYLESPSALSGGPHRTETFIMPGSPAREVAIYRTEHGPVLTQEPAITAWKYSQWGEKELNTIQAFLDLARAQSMDEFGEALQDVGVSQHFCYADREGNIAYWMSGRDPVRGAGEYRFPQGSLAGLPIAEWDIETVLPLAHDRNPPRGFYGGWNNKAKLDYDNAPLSGRNFGPSHRADTIVERLTQMSIDGPVSFEEVRDLAIDVAATQEIKNGAWPYELTNGLQGGGDLWGAFSEIALPIVAANSSPTREAALSIMADYDGHFISGGPLRWISGDDRADAWMLQDAWLRRVLALTFDEVNPGLLNGFNTILHALRPGSSLQNSYDWFSNLNDDTAPQTAEAIILQALDDSLDALGPQPWGIGLRGQLDFVHPLLSAQTGQPLHQTPLSNRSTYAQCVEMGVTGPVRIESAFPLGQSGAAFLDFSVPGNLRFDDNAFSMVPFFDEWVLRAFPLFANE